MIYTVTEESGTKGLEQLAGSASTGTPLGTWASFENDYAPNIEWLQGGTTFNPNTYPALAMYLGGNTVPERFDHNRLGAEEYIDMFSHTTSATALTVDYDGFMTFGWKSGSGYIGVVINGIAFAVSGSYGDYLTLPVKKGDEVYVTNYATQGINYTCGRFYKHPLFIKATPTSADSDYEGTLNAIREFYVRNNTYSTEERLTGGYWIDGKKIYKRTFYDSNNSITDGTSLSVPYAETLIDYTPIWRAGLGNMYAVRSYTLRNAGTASTDLISGDTFNSGTSITFYYTKTTD